ncbi:ribosome-inactivating protein [Trichoderma pleuroticola]
MPNAIQFTINFLFDSDDEGIETYNAFIKDIRDRLAVGERIENVPVLAPQVSAGGTLEFFDLNLSYTDRGATFTIQVRFRTDNLYLIGYRAENSGTWYELGREGAGRRPLIDDTGTTTQFLGFGENYNDLTRTADMDLERVRLSYTDIGAAIQTLAGTVTDRGQRARAILTLAISIAEAARFRDVSSLVSRSWWNPAGLGVQFGNRVRSWGRLSAAVQMTRNYGPPFVFDGDSTGIYDFISAIAALGIMHLAHTASRLERSADDMAGAVLAAGPFAQGRPLLEIYYVRINYINGEDPGDLYGTVTVTDGAGTHSIWERDHHSSVEISPGEDIRLEGPRGPLSAADEFYIHLDLWDYDSVSADDPIAQGTIAFNPLDYFTEYDVFQNILVSGTSGSVMLAYEAITDGLCAKIAVILIRGDDEDPADVYGNITANNSPRKSELFRKSSSEYVEVRPQHEIPLSRAIVAVPTTGTLRVDAHLWDWM